MRHRAIGNCALTKVLAIFALGLMFVGVSGIASAGTTERVSVASDGTQGDARATDSALSADGRFVAVQSAADNLVEGDTNASYDIFVHDRQTGQTERVSVASDGTQGNGPSTAPSNSADGRFVAFGSFATNVVEGDTNGYYDAFVHDRHTGQTIRVSVASDGTQGNHSALTPSISADGYCVVFYSDASNLVPSDSNGRTDVFVHDRQTSQTTRVSVASDGTQGNERSYYCSISGDGRFVAFTSRATNLIGGDTNGSPDCFVHDRHTGRTTRVSVASDGTQGNTDSTVLSINGDGRYVAFCSLASNLVEADTNAKLDVFVHDRQISQTIRVSVASDGTQGNNRSLGPSISPDGQFVGFYSDASNLVAGDTNGKPDVFFHDRHTGRTTRVSVASDGTQGDSNSLHLSVNSDGRFAAFLSDAGNLVAGDTNGVRDVFVHDRFAVLTVTISGSGTGTVELSSPGGAYAPGTTVTLTAVASPGSFFDHWEDDLTGSDNPATILMDANKNIVAHFIYPQLTVLSAPIVDVAITGTGAGTTPYSADCGPNEVVTLTAPESVSVGGKTYYFEFWSVNNETVAPIEGRPFNEVEVTMDDRRTAVAQYDWRLPGDYNDDCTVNILDLLFVRNRLQTMCSE